MKRHSQQGIALIITLILLSVITFMAVTFLIVSRGEKGSVTTALDRTTAKLAADSALERAKANLIANMLATANPYNYDLLVSTNYINYTAGFQSGIANVINVNYQYANGAPLTAADLIQNIANLLIDPRPPVVVLSNSIIRSNDFRFYLDLNRNGRYETNGFWPVISPDPNRPYYDANGNLTATYTPNVRQAFFVGDPEWIGVLDRPDTNLPHSANNKFISRYAFIALPAGKSLDLNHIHNQAEYPNPVNKDGFLRNQGVGTWEINLAAFLADLNTNQWSPPGNSYKYNNLFGSPPFSAGAAFEDALALLLYRYGGSWYNLPSVSQLFGAQGQNAFWSDYVDGYAGGPLMTNYLGWNVAPDFDKQPVPTYSPLPSAPRTMVPWFGAGNTNQYFAMQDLFDPAKAGLWTQSQFNITNRLYDAGTSNSSYDRYTFYRLLAQLGEDSVPEPAGKMNLNYDNLNPYVFVSGNPIKNINGVAASTNFVSWQPLDFFTNAADRMLRTYTAQWYGPANAFGVTHIPVLVSNQFVYSPSIHRVLQLAANMYDASTNRTYTDTNYPYLPTVFQPLFAKTNANGRTDVYIYGFAEVISTNFLAAGTLRDLVDQTVVNALQTNDLVFGVPLVIGAKNGFPNFNEFALQAVSQLTRKIQISRDSTNPATAIYTTNVMYILGVTNVSFGVEAWNSYRSNYTRDVDLYVTNYQTVALTVTNDSGAGMTPIISNMVWGAHFPILSNGWRGYSSGAYPNLDKLSFQVPLLTNVVFLTNVIYTYKPPGFNTNLSAGYETNAGYHWPQPVLSVTNRLLFFMVDRASGRLIDYVQLKGLDGVMDATAAISTNAGTYYAGLWNTNRIKGADSQPWGDVWQIAVALGQDPGNATDWRSYGAGNASGNDKPKAIAGFKAFFGLSTPDFPDTVNTNFVVQVPFTPTAEAILTKTWEANDPLVHYMIDDLVDLNATNSVRQQLPSVALPPLGSIGSLNNRYLPWGGNPQQSTDTNRFNLAIKDPGVRSSDDWQFPTNKFATIGWLGRVHRGTPWQTVYLKAADILQAPNGLGTWRLWTGNATTNWSGNPPNYDTVYSAPVNDRLLFDLFTTAFNDNATRGQLSINQTNLAAWSALFGGVVVLTNTSPDTPSYSLNQTPTFAPLVNNTGTGYGIDPAGADPNAPLLKIVNGINRTRAAFPQQTFTHLGDILATPELTVGQTIPANYAGTYPNGYWTNVSPFLNLGNPNVLDLYTHTTFQQQSNLNDEVYEWLPQQVLSLLTVGPPRFVIYSYGQALRPAPGSLVTGGPYFGLCTNYQVMAEVATRSVVRVDTVLFTNSTSPLRITTNYSAVVESYNVLPPD